MSQVNETTGLKSMNSINKQYMLNETVEGFTPEDEADLAKELQGTTRSFIKNIFYVDTESDTNFFMEEQKQENKSTNTLEKSFDHDIFDAETQDASDYFIEKRKQESDYFFKPLKNARESNFLKIIKSVNDLNTPTIRKPPAPLQTATTIEKRVNGRNIVTKNICNRRKGYNSKCKKCTMKKQLKSSGRTNPHMHIMMEDLSLVLAVKLRVTDNK